LSEKDGGLEIVGCEEQGLERERPRLRAGFGRDLMGRLTRCWREVAMVALMEEESADGGGRKMEEENVDGGGRKQGGGDR
jgi:hypothetical protein